MKSTALSLDHYIPSIVITSYLPDSKSKRELRFNWHLEQRQELERVFKTDKIGQIVSVCSNYNKKELDELKRLKYAGFAFEKRKYRWEKFNFMLRHLYKFPRLHTILFLDDDVVPRPEKEEDLENGMVNSAKLVYNWLREPDQMPGQLGWFACQGSLADAYYRNNPTIIGEAPTHVTGWAMMVRSDLNVLFTKDLVCEEGKEQYLLDDFPFRVKCGSLGKQVIKHYRAFFKSYQSKDKAEKDSTWFDSQEQRNATNKYQNERMKKMFPDFFSRSKKSSKIDSSKKTGFFKGDKNGN